LRRAFFGRRQVHVTREPAKRPRPASGFPPSRAAHVIAPSVSALSKSLRTTVMRAVNDLPALARSCVTARAASTSGASWYDHTPAFGA
jgi:hypothetical protein